MRQLIVNADDFNLTEGISRAVFFAHDHGIVNSTSVMINFPLSQFQLQGLKNRPNLGTGLHLNVTSGLSRFKKANAYLSGQFDPRNLKVEYNAQIQYFYSIFKRLPDHLNTHHHIHASPKVFSVVAKLAEKYKIPMRRINALTLALSHKVGEGKSLTSSPLPQGEGRVREVMTTHYFFGNLSPQKYWTEESLMTILENLPEGTSEIMCHPGFIDSELRSKSSFLAGRDFERRLFSKNSIHQFLRHQGIQQVKFSSLRSGSVL